MPEAAQPKVVKKRTPSKLDEKIWLLDLKQKRPKLSQNDLARLFKEQFGKVLSSSTISDWLKPKNQQTARELYERSRLNSNAKTDVTRRQRAPECKKLEAALAMWFNEREGQSRPPHTPRPLTC